MKRIKHWIKPLQNNFPPNPSHSVQNSLPLSHISNLQKLFGKNCSESQKQRPQI